MTTTHEAIACTSTSSEATTRSLEWDTLRDQSRSSVAIDKGIMMTFDASLAGEIENLAETEQACCAFLSIVVSTTSQEVRLEITAENPDALPMLQAIAGLER